MMILLFILPLMAFGISHNAFKFNHLKATATKKGWKIKYIRSLHSKIDFTNIDTRNLIMRDDFYLTLQADPAKDEISNLFLCSEFREKHRDGKV